MSRTGDLIAMVDISREETRATVELRLLRSDGRLVDRLRHVARTCGDGDFHDEDAPPCTPPPDAGMAGFVARANRLLVRGGYRSLTELPMSDDGSDDGEDAPIARSSTGTTTVTGGGLRIVHQVTDRDLSVATVDGRSLWRGRLPRVRITCGMITANDDSDLQPPEILAVHASAAADTVLITYGHRYDSCMCDYEDRRYRMLRVAH